MATATLPISSEPRVSEMRPRTGEIDHDYGDRLDRIERALERISMPQNNTRSVDTLRRDIGIFSILIGMMVQTGAAFYWAGGVSTEMKSLKEQYVQIQAEQAYQRAQNQLLDGSMKKFEAREDERNRRPGGR